MRVSLKKVCALAGVLGVMSSPAMAEYSFHTDPTYPSVIFVDFPDDGGDPLVIQAPRQSNGITVTSPSSDPIVRSSSTSSSSTQSGDDEPQLSVEDRINNRIDELEADEGEVAEQVVDEVVVDRLLEGATLR